MPHASNWRAKCGAYSPATHPARRSWCACPLELRRPVDSFCSTVLGRRLLPAAGVDLCVCPSNWPAPRRFALRSSNAALRHRSAGGSRGRSPTAVFGMVGLLRWSQHRAPTRCRNEALRRSWPSSFRRRASAGESPVRSGTCFMGDRVDVVGNATSSDLRGRESSGLPFAIRSSRPLVRRTHAASNSWPAPRRTWRRSPRLKSRPVWQLELSRRSV